MIIIIYFDVIIIIEIEGNNSKRPSSQGDDDKNGRCMDSAIIIFITTLETKTQITIYYIMVQLSAFALFEEAAKKIADDDAADNINSDHDTTINNIYRPRFFSFL